MSHPLLLILFKSQFPSPTSFAYSFYFQRNSYPEETLKYLLSLGILILLG